MNLKKCPLCDKIKPLLYHVTEVENGKAKESFSLCQECASVYLEDTKHMKAWGEMGSGVLQPETPPEEEPVAELSIDISDVNTPEQLLDFIAAHEKMSSIEPCSNCGLSWLEFDEVGRFGCAHCYEHFKDIITPVLEKYHGDSWHVGKRPKTQLENPEEKLKTLKLKMARAVEHEQYELAGELKQEIKQLIDNCDSVDS